MTKCGRKIDWYYTEQQTILPKTTTQEMLESGLRKIAKPKIVARKQLNFQSYPMNEFRFGLMAFDRPMEVAQISSYNRDYTPPNDFSTHPIEAVADKEPDPLCNRKPPNDFGMRQTSKYKFMDDHFINLSESRKKIDSMRQLRNAHQKFV